MSQSYSLTLFIIGELRANVGVTKTLAVTSATSIYIIATTLEKKYIRFEFVKQVSSNARPSTDLVTFFYTRLGTHC